MEALRLVRKVDELGRGKNIIFVESLKNGYKPPIVEITNVGRLNRWSLIIYCGASNEKSLRILDRIKEQYGDTNKSLIALALILWRNYKVTEILDYFGSDEFKLLAEVLADLNGPIYYYKSNEQITLNRWVRVLLEEGKESKSFTPSEEENLYKFVLEMQSEYHNGFVSLKDLRKYAHMGESAAERTLSSKMMNKWLTENKVKRISKGVYKFKNKQLDDRTERALRLLETFEKHLQESAKTNQGET